MKNMIFTCGTSICNEFTIHNSEHLKASQKLDDNQSSFEYIYDSIKESYEGCEEKDLGAEIYTLLKLEKYNDDNIYFFFSETKGGELVKDLFEKTNILIDRVGKYNFKFKIINGFKVNDKDSFKKNGIKSFYSQLDEIKKSGNKTIMCPVGGYKALIPYASLYAMVNGWDIKYIYEDSDELMDLPSGALTNFTGDVLLKNTLNYEIFHKDNVSNNYDFKQGLELIFGVKNFIEYGKSKELSKICKELKNTFYEQIKLGNNKLINEKSILECLEKYLLNLSDAFDLIRVNDIEENILKILEIKTDKLNDLLLRSSIEFLQSELKKVDKNNFIKWYFERGRYAEVILIMREGVIDFIGNKLNISYSSRDERLKIENTLQLFRYSKKDPNRSYLLNYQEIEIQKIFKGNETFFEKLTDKRNNFAHLNSKESLKSMKDGIKKLYEEYIEVL